VITFLMRCEMSMAFTVTILQWSTFFRIPVPKQVMEGYLLDLQELNYCCVKKIFQWKLTPELRKCCTSLSMFKSCIVEERIVTRLYMMVLNLIYIFDSQLALPVPAVRENWIENAWYFP
jgi:hypothetical protein